MQNPWSKKVRVDVATKIITSQARISFETFNSLITSMGDRLELIEEELRELRDQYNQVFQKAMVISS